MLPPGDIRKNIAALADAEPLMSRLFEYRFAEGDGLEGHSFGNLFIVAMTEVAGNFEEAVRETSRVLAVRGQILPATLSALTICARTDDGEIVRGESAITEHGHVKEIFLDPPTIQANPDAIRAILQADIIVCGPGSLMTSVLPNLLVEGIRRAIEVSPALKVYVCNVATQHGETDAFKVSDHFNALREHLHGAHLFDFVLANSNTEAVLPEEWHSETGADRQQRARRRARHRAPTSSPRRTATATTPRSSPTRSSASTTSATSSRKPRANGGCP